ncbi:restriction endonuclease subunit S [Lactococcus sp. KTH0-1S]|uniref:restriction endonuclease subunit S n=1 Tax=Lactococcus sp. KTH0-1S TaxID=3438232 RepID=UPI00403D4EEE
MTSDNNLNVEKNKVDVSKNVPELRFQGFIDAWELRKLSDVTKRVIRKNKNLESTLPLTISAQEGLIDQNEFFNKTVASRDVSGYYLIKNGEFAYNKSYSNGYPWGAVKRLNRYNIGVLSTLYIVFKPTNIDTDFLEKYYDTTNWYKEVSKHAAEGARNHGLLNIAATDFFKTELVISKSLEEQQKIGVFFKQLDDTIALHQRKLDKLKLLKQGYLQQLFPKNDEKVPRVRFTNFEHEWELRKLGNVFKKIRNAFVGTATPYYIDSGHFYLESNNVKNGEINRDTEVFINDEFYNKQADKLLHTGDIVMVQSGHVGHTAVIPSELDGTAAHALIMFTDYKEDTDPFFLNYQFQTHKSKRKLDTITTGNTIKHILSSEMKEFFVDYPCFEEQQKIGEFFEQLNDSIALHQSKLDKLKSIKQSLLQKMFI